MKRLCLLFIFILLPVMVNADSVSLAELYEIKDNQVALSKVTNVQVNKFDDINNLDLLEKCPNVNYILIEKQDIKDMEAINKIKSTTDVNIYFEDVFVDLKGISNNYIKEISFSMSHVKNFEAVLNLGELKTLKFVSSDGYKNVSFSKLKNLETLIIETQIIDNYEQLAKEITQVKTLSLEESNLKNADGKYLKQLQNLEILNIGKTYVDDVSFLIGMPNLKDVTLPLGLEKEDLEVLRSMPKLTNVNWDGYTELQVSASLLDYLDNKGIYYPRYYPEINDEVNKIIAELNLSSNASVREKVYSVSRYIAKNMKYSMDYNEEYATALDEFVLDKTGVCYNYTVFTYTILKKLGVEDIYYVAGPVYETENAKYNFGAHAWNSIKIDNTWYGIDNTWVGNDEGDYLENNLKEYVLVNLMKDSSDYAKFFEVQHISYNQPRDAFKSVGNNNNDSENNDIKAKIRVIVTTNENSYGLNKEIEYKIKVMNMGTTMAQNIEIKAVFDDRFDILKAENGIVKGSEIVYKINELKVGETKDFVVKLKLKKSNITEIKKETEIKTDIEVNEDGYVWC